MELLAAIGAGLVFGYLVRAQHKTTPDPVIITRANHQVNRGPIYRQLVWRGPGWHKDEVEVYQGAKIPVNT